MPLGESMITVLRNNKRKKVNGAFFKQERTTVKDKQKGGFEHKKANPELIHNIKIEMQQKRKARNKKLIYTGLIISILLVASLWFLKDQNYI